MVLATLKLAMRSNFELISATVEHAATLGAIHVQAWRETYAGQMPDEYLSGLDAVRRAAHWRKILLSPGPREASFLIHHNGEEAGFVSFGPGRGKNLNSWGEIYALYLLKSHQRRGLGTALYRTAVERLVGWGYRKIGIWVLATNRIALDFYHAQGASATPTRQRLDFGGASLEEIFLAVNF